MRENLYDKITEAVLASVDGAGQWKPSWIGRSMRPVNAATGRRYGGINILLLWQAADEKGYTQNRWATYWGWANAGGQVRKGEKSTEVVLVKPTLVKAGTPDEKRYTYMRTYHVFNADQVDGDVAKAPELVAMRDGQRFNEAERVIIDTKATIINEGNPRYRPATDEVFIPLFERFTNPASYYSTMFHELGHWTGHSSRLNRDLRPRFELASYAMEELVAEMCSAFVCGAIGIESSMREDHAAYLKAWLEVLQRDHAAIVTAAAAASKAADFILNAGAQALEEAA